MAGRSFLKAKYKNRSINAKYKTLGPSLRCDHPTADFDHTRGAPTISTNILSDNIMQQ